MNATDPRFVMPLFRAALQAGDHYLDMAMSLSHPAPAMSRTRRPGSSSATSSSRWPAQWEQAGQLALVGIGVEPGLSDVFARYAADHLFSEIDELGVRDGANLAVAGYDFAPTFSIWTTIEECLNPPVIWEKDRGWFTTPPFSEPEIFTFPAGIGPVECVNVEHEEVLLMPRWVEASGSPSSTAWATEFIERAARPCTSSAWTAPTRSASAGVEVSPRDVVAACLPDPATLGDKMTRPDLRGHLGDRHRQGRRAARGLPVPRRRQRLVDGRVRLAGRGLADRGQPGRRPGADRLRRLVGTGVLGPEALPAEPFLDLLTEYGSPWACEERTPAGKLTSQVT